MTMEDEIKFYMDAKAKAVAAGKEKDFEQRMNLLFLEGQITENSYLILRQIFGYTTIVRHTPKLAVNFRSTTC